MKKVISVSMVIAMIFAFTACSSAEYTDTPVTITVTDENGEAVTDESGNAVTEVVTDENGNTKTETKKNTTAKNSTKNTTDKNSDNQNSANNSNNGDGNNSNSDNKGGNNAGNNEDNNSPTNQPDTTKPTTAKPKKRDVTITVNLPYYNSKKTEITLYYKVDNDKEYTELETREIELDGKGKNKTQTFTIEDVKGEVIAFIKLKDVSITHDSVTIPASGENSDSGVITPITGIEIMDGGMD